MNKRKLFRDVKRKIVVEAIKKAHDEIPENDDDLRKALHEVFCYFCTDDEYDSWIFLNE